MNLVNRVNDIAIGTVRILDGKIIYTKYSDKSIRALNLKYWNEIWSINQDFVSINQCYKDFLCNGNLTLFSLKDGGIIYKSTDKFWFSSLVHENIMLFKKTLNEVVYWYLFDNENFTLNELDDNLTGLGNAIYFDDERIIFRKGDINCFNFKGEELWTYPNGDSFQIGATSIFKNILYLPIHNQGIYALDTNTGKVIWQMPIDIDAFDEEKGLIYVLQNDFIVIDAVTGEEVIRVKDWSKNQLEKYPALFFGGSPCSLSEEYIVFPSRASFDEFGECGIFFIDKETAEVKEYFRIVFDKDQMQRTGWDGNKIPDDQQIPFMPLDKPIYKNGRLYVTLPSPIEGQKDLYIYEKE